MKKLMKVVIAAAALVAVGVRAAQALCNPLTDLCWDDTTPLVALVPIIVNFEPVSGHDTALVSARFTNNTDQLFPAIELLVKPGEEDTMRLPLNGPTGIRNGAQTRQGSPAIVSNRAGKVTLNLPAQSYKNAEVSLYSVNGKRVLRNAVSASRASNSVSRRNVTAGVYLLSVKGADGGAITSRLTHRGGNLDIKVAFSDERSSYIRRLSKKTDDIDDGSFWTITVHAYGYEDTTYEFRPLLGMNERQVINLRPKDLAGSMDVFKVTAKALIAPSGNDPAVKTAAVGANDFAFRLGAELAKGADGKNFVFSPYSVWMPLAALVNATDAKYKDALLTALGASGVTQDDINAAASRMLYNLTKSQYRGMMYDESSPNPLKIANAIFVGKNVTLRESFAQAFMDFYRGSSFNVDFQSGEAADAVNGWASENTDGLITKVIERFDPNTVAAIANAIYFSDRWQSEFNPDKTTEGDFHAPSGNTRASYMLREDQNHYYYDNERAQAVSLKFKTGGGLCIILPKTGTGSVEELYSSMTNDAFVEIRKNTVLAEGNLLLPRFSIENDVKGLMEGLKLLGVPLFDIDNNPISNLIEQQGINLGVTSVTQKAVIKVDEKGTTAAAVTVMEVGTTSVPQPQRRFEMICDRPFMFVLYDYTYDGGDQVLFTGIVNKP